MGLGSRKGVGKNNEKKPPCQGSGRSLRRAGGLLRPAVDLLADRDAGGDLDPVSASGVHGESPGRRLGPRLGVRGECRVGRNRNPTGDQSGRAALANR
jgi:hypothetical protein